MPRPRSRANSSASDTVAQLCSLLSASVLEAQRLGVLPQNYDWSSFQISKVKITNTAVTHYSPSVIRNAHRFNQLAAAEQASSYAAASSTLPDPTVLASTWSSALVPVAREVLAASPLADQVKIIYPPSDSFQRPGGTIDFFVAEENTSTDAASSSAALVDSPSPVPDQKSKKPRSGEANSESITHSSSSHSQNLSFSPATNYPGFPSITFTPIGILNSCFKLKYGTPRQGSITPYSRGKFTLRPDIDATSLDGLQEYSHVWLVFLFHENTNKKFNPKIKPPRLGGKKLGVFATRSPMRANPIGLSLAKLERIEGRTVHLNGIDLIDGTPILDIKPFHPADRPPLDQSFFCASWLNQADQHQKLNVKFEPEAEAKLREMVEEKKFEFFSDFQSIYQAIHDSCAEDPRPIYIRKRHDPEALYGFRIDSVNVLFSVDRENARIREIMWFDAEAEMKQSKQETEEDGEDQQSDSEDDGANNEKETFKRWIQKMQRPKRKSPEAATESNADNKNNQTDSNQ